MRQVRALMLGVTLIALMVACSGYLLLQEMRASAGSSPEPVEVLIEPGESTSEIAAKLASQGLIRQPVIFTTLVRAQGLDGKLQAGRYVLNRTMTMGDILVTLQFNRVGDVEVRITEGMRLEEIAEVLAETEIVSEEAFLAAARNGDAFKANHFLLTSLPAGASLEGYLFPDTYRIAATASVTDIIEVLLDRFDEQYSTFEKDVRVPDVSVHQLVTMASIVQREAALESEMPLIAAVFWNRLKTENVEETGDGRLGSDATVQYALGYSPDERTWWRKYLTANELAFDNPYNTRARAGLPPGPISNPGLAALQAAAQPDETANYLYFVVSCDLDGSHHFTTTFEEFQEYEAEYLACSGQQ
ncbi:MAG: endolytic transglycosylase MltG [Chloroflexaceae bacterium]|nr:endolytic transglycosylase MltG [Chloroflexaceae bacterium]